MASFEQHVNGAVIATGVVIAPLHAASLIDVEQSLILLTLGLVGGILPDLDSDNSTPIQIVFKILSIFLPLLAILTFTNDLPLVHLMGIWLVSGFILHLTLFKFFLSLTTHRGIIHSIPMGVLLAQGTTYLFFYTLEYDLVFSTIAGGFLLFGFIVHLLLDEFVSLNLLGFHIKKSFGSALKFYDRNNIIGTVLLYIIIIVFFFFTPIKVDVFVEIFEIMKNVKVI